MNLKKNLTHMRRVLAKESPGPPDDLDDAAVIRFWELREQMEQTKSRLIEAKDFRTYFCWANHNQRLEFFLRVHEQLTDKQYWRELAEAWTGSETTMSDLRVWKRLFESPRPGRERLMRPSDARYLSGLYDPLTVFRGYAKGRGKSGLSWTLSESVAFRFASEYASGLRRQLLCGHSANVPGIVVSGQCRKADVIAYVNDRKEGEIVINPAKVFSKRVRAVSIISS